MKRSSQLRRLQNIHSAPLPLQPATCHRPYHQQPHPFSVRPGLLAKGTHFRWATEERINFHSHAPSPHDSSRPSSHPAYHVTTFTTTFSLLDSDENPTADTILGRHSSMEIRSIHLGGMFHAEEEIQMTSMMPNFVGHIQGFVYNGHR